MHPSSTGQSTRATIARHLFTVVIATFILIDILASALSAVGGAPGQGASPSRLATYSNTQADRGKTLYTASCAVCHGAELGGSATVPPLKGPDFESYWLGKPVGELFEKIVTTMPKAKPGSLTPAESSDLVAYLLRELQAPAGPADLSSTPSELNELAIGRP